MSLTLATLAPLTLLGTALAAAVVLAGRWITTPAQWDRAQSASAPVWIRLALRPAMMLEPVVHRCLPATYAGKLEQAMESLGLQPMLSPARWIAARLVLGTAAGLTTLATVGPLAGALGGAGVYGLCGRWLANRRKAQAAQIARELPAYLDLLTVCVEAGASLTSGARLIVGQSPPGPVRSYFEQVLREVRGGRPRAQSFTHVAGIFAVESLTTLASALTHAESSGMSLGQVLRAQAQQRTAERFSRAERLAMQAPVKMLGPLILCIFPCTFIVIAVPIAVRLREALGT